MPRTIEAVIESDGHVRLLEPVTFSESRRALVTVLDELPMSERRARPQC
jgi:hypothetical protein